ncbi:MAG: OB-fold nucleic acid binding domain-containing protein [Acidimicrobiales bacterium]
MDPARATDGRRYSQLNRLAVEVLGGVGPRKASALADMGITTVLDLITYFPRRYLDRTSQVRLGEMALGEEATVLATVKRVQARPMRNHRSLVEVVVNDGPSHLYCTFFNQPWRTKQLSPGQSVVVFGKLEDYRGRRQMTNPVVDLVGDRTGRMVALYPQSDKAGLSTWELSKWIGEALDRAGDFADPLPEKWRRQLDLMTRTEAMRAIHNPASMATAVLARRRLAFDELLRLQLILVMTKSATQRQARGIVHQVGEGYRSLWESLPFTPTSAQLRATEAIGADLAGPYPMHRLLQGDVGAGKTVVALGALVTGVDGGYQGALMAPTEVLAEQHFLGVRSLVEGIVVKDGATLGGQRPLRVDLLTSRRTAKERARVLGDLGEDRYPHRHPCPAERPGELCQLGGGGNRRAAPLWGGATCASAVQGAQRT